VQRCSRVGHLARCCDSDPGGERREDLGIPPFKSARTSCDKTLRSTPETMPSVDLPRWVGRGTILCAEDGRGCRFTTGFQRADFTRGYPLLAKLARPHRKANRGLLLALCALDLFYVWLSEITLALTHTCVTDPISEAFTCLAARSQYSHAP